jgi:hypothetical protein
LIIPDSLRFVLTLAAGIVIGLLIALGLIKGFSSGSATTLAGPTTTQAQARLQPSAAATPEVTEKTELVDATPTPAGGGSSAEEQNGTPPGVTRQALDYNKDIYQKYPGLQPPHINTDGRNLGPEAIKSYQSSPTMLANPLPSPSGSVTPAPLPFLSPVGSASPARPTQ